MTSKRGEDSKVPCNGFCGRPQLLSKLQSFSNCNHRICNRCIESPVADGKNCPNARCFGRRLTKAIADRNDLSFYLTQVAQACNLESIYRSASRDPIYEEQLAPVPNPSGTEDELEDDESNELIAVDVLIVECDEVSQKIFSKTLRKEVGDGWTLARVFYTLIKEKKFVDPMKKASMLLKPRGKCKLEDCVLLSPRKDAHIKVGDLADTVGEGGPVSIVVDYVHSEFSQQNIAEFSDFL